MPLPRGGNILRLCDLLAAPIGLQRFPIDPETGKVAGPATPSGALFPVEGAVIHVSYDVLEARNRRASDSIAGAAQMVGAVERVFSTDGVILAWSRNEPWLAFDMSTGASLWQRPLPKGKPEEPRRPSKPHAGRYVCRAAGEGIFVYSYETETDGL